MRLHHGLELLHCEQDGTANYSGSTRQPPAVPRGARSARQTLVCKAHIRPPVLCFRSFLYAYSVRQSTAFAKRFYTNSPLCLSCSELVRKVLCKFPTQYRNSMTFTPRLPVPYFEQTAVKNLYCASWWVRAAVLARAARISSAGAQQTCRPIRPAET